MTALHPQRIPWLSLALGVVLAGLAGCRPMAGETAVAPDGGIGSPEGPDDSKGLHESDSSVGDLWQRLEKFRREREMKLEPASSDAAVCEDLCGLATSICQVQSKLCELADDHPDENDYQDLCREAKLECREAQESCVDCVRGHGASARPESAVGTQPGSAG